jgi:hypothetical protein
MGKGITGKTRMNIVLTSKEYNLSDLRTVLAYRFMDYMNTKYPNSPVMLFNCGGLGICTLLWNKTHWDYLWDTPINVEINVEVDIEC